MMEKTVRVYGKVLNEWFSTDDYGRVILTQTEVAYKEYRENGELKATGTEDFSPVRWNKATKKRWIFTWDGEKLNKGGHRRFEDQGMIRYAGDTKVIKSILQSKYNAALIELRA